MEQKLIKTNKLFAPSVNFSWNNRKRTLLLIFIILGLLAGIYLFGLAITEEKLKPNFTQKNLPPSMMHYFGTDWLGRDMFYRTLKGLSTSITIGLIASVLSGGIAVILGMLAASGARLLDALISWLIDLTMSIPHLLLLILISFATGGGMNGIMLGLIFTHWAGLARLVRSEVTKLRSQEYIQVSKRLGKSNTWVMVHHFLPHLVPVFIVGIVLLFPHAILHESAISFLGFGLSPEQPAIGIILAESMRYLTAGFWWLAVIPGVFLLMIVLLFDCLGESLKKVFDPYDAQK